MTVFLHVNVLLGRLFHLASFCCFGLRPQAHFPGPHGLGHALILSVAVYSPRYKVSLMESSFVTIAGPRTWGDSEDGSPLTLPLDLQSRLACTADLLPGLRNGVKKWRVKMRVLECLQVGFWLPFPTPNRQQIKEQRLPDWVLKHDAMRDESPYQFERILGFF